MTPTTAVFRKELKSYFNSPIAYIATLFFLVFSSVWFFYIQHFFASNSASMRVFFSVMPTIFTVLVPALTMRSWAEEKRMGTAELLLTLPFRERDVVIGKFLATFSLLAIMLALTIPVPLSVSAFGHFDPGQIVGEYLGILLLGAAAIAIGQFISSVSSNQISAFIFGVIVLIAITMVSQAASIFNLPVWFAAVLNYLSLGYHFESLIKGVVDTRDVLYFLVAVTLFLYLNTKVLVFKKWR
jgi:ABC-2 type transport system permease protein